MKTYDDLIVGGGVVGLSLAWELARAGRAVHLIERDPNGEGTSWAGAGILPPANVDAAHDPIDQLRGMSHRLLTDGRCQVNAPASTVTIVDTR